MEALDGLPIIQATAGVCDGCTVLQVQMVQRCEHAWLHMDWHGGGWKNGAPGWEGWIGAGYMPVCSMVLAGVANAGPGKVGLALVVGETDL